MIPNMIYAALGSTIFWYPLPRYWYVIKSAVWRNLLLYIKGKHLFIQHYNSVSGTASFNTVDL